MPPLYTGRISPEPYQFVPLARLLSGPRRGLLIADDVGLGKTIEAGICLLELIPRGAAKRILLVVPLGLIPQWLNDEMWEKFGLEFQPWSGPGFVDRLVKSEEKFKRPSDSSSRISLIYEICQNAPPGRVGMNGSPERSGGNPIFIGC